MGSHVTLSEVDLLWPATLPSTYGTTAVTSERDRFDTSLDRNLSTGAPLSKLALTADTLDRAQTTAQTDPAEISPLVSDILSIVESVATQNSSAGKQVLAGNYTMRVQQYGIETLATLAPDHLSLGTEQMRTRLFRVITAVLTNSDAIAVVRPALDLLGTLVVASEEVTGPMLTASGVVSGVRRWLPALDGTGTRLDAIRVLGACSVTADSIPLSESAIATLRQAATADDLLSVVWSSLVIERLNVSVDGIPIHTSADKPTYRTVQLLCRLLELDASGDAPAESSATATLERLLDTTGHLDGKQEQYAPAFASLRAFEAENPTALQTETTIQALGEFAVAGCFPTAEISQRICDVLADILAHSETPPVLTEAASTLERLATAGDLINTECKAAFTALARAMYAPNQTDPEPLAAALVALVATKSVESITLSGLQEGAELCGPVLGPGTDIQTAVRPFRHPAVPDRVPELVVDAFRSSLGSITSSANQVPALVLAVMQRRGLLSGEPTYATSCRRYCAASVSSDSLGLRTQAPLDALAHSGLLKQADLSESVEILTEGIDPASEASSTIAAERLNTLVEAGCLDTHYAYRPVVDALCRAAHPTTEPDPKSPLEALTALGATNALPADGEYIPVIDLIEDVLSRGVDTSVLSRFVESGPLDATLSRATTDEPRPSLRLVSRLLAVFLTNEYLSDTRSLEHIATLFAAHVPAPDSGDVLQTGAAFGLGIMAAKRPLTDVTFTKTVRRLIAWTDPDLAGDGETAALVVSTLAREGYIDASLQLPDLSPLRRMATTPDAAIDSRQPLVCLGTLLQTHPAIPQGERDQSTTTLLESAAPGDDTHTFAAALALSWAVDADTDLKPDLSALIDDLCTSMVRLSERPPSADIEDYLALSGVSVDTHSYDLDAPEAAAVLDTLATAVDPERLVPAITDAMTSIAGSDGSPLAGDSATEQLLHALHTSLVLSSPDFELASVDDGPLELGPVPMAYLTDPDGTTATQIRALDLLCYWGD